MTIKYKQLKRVDDKIHIYFDKGGSDWCYIDNNTRALVYTNDSGKYTIELKDGKTSLLEFYTEDRNEQMDYFRAIQAMLIGKSPKIDKKGRTVKTDIAVIRGDKLTINYNGTVKHIRLSNRTRVVLYNEELPAVNKRSYKHIVEIKEGLESKAHLLCKDAKSQREIYDIIKSLLNKYHNDYN
jgi:hypothetical protein